MLARVVILNREQRDEGANCCDERLPCLGFKHTIALTDSRHDEHVVNYVQKLMMSERLTKIGGHAQVKKLALLRMIVMLGRQHDDRSIPQALVRAGGQRNKYFFPADARHHII